MNIETRRETIATSGHGHIVDITLNVKAVTKRSNLSEGSALVFIVGSTAALTTVEYEPGLVEDLTVAFERLYPRELGYAHHQTWGDDNGHSHVRASMLGPSLVIPFVDSVLLLGTWQQIILVDFDTRERDREFIVQLTGH